MSADELPDIPFPLWKKCLVIVAVLPVLAFPWLLSLCPQDNSTTMYLLWAYPFAEIGSGVLAWLCQKQRPEVSWILIVLMLLMHGAILLLVKPELLMNLS